MCVHINELNKQHVYCSDCLLDFNLSLALTSLHIGCPTLLVKVVWCCVQPERNTVRNYLGLRKIM